MARLQEKLADQKALRQSVGQAKNDLRSMERPNRYKRPARINLTDKDVRLMRIRKWIMPSYNAQAMVSPVAAEGVGGMLVTATDVVDEPKETTRLIQMAEQAEEITGVRMPLTLADAGYFAGKHVAELHHRGQQVVMPDKARPTDHPYHNDQFIYDEETDSYTCPHGQNLTFTGMKSDRKKSRIYRVASEAICRECPAFGTCTKNERYGRSVEIGLHDVALRRHMEWMATDEAKQMYVRRLPLVEPLFAIIKNQIDAHQFKLRGIANVRAE